MLPRPATEAGVVSPRGEGSAPEPLEERPVAKARGAASKQMAADFLEASGVDAGCLTAEVLSPGRFGALVYDLEKGWDLCDPERQRLARREIEDRPGCWRPPRLA